jgi:spore maturation protein CgeB
MLLADRTQEHQAFFEEGREAEFFAGEEELVDKAVFYVRHDQARARIAQAGRERCLAGRYAYVHRLQDALAAMERL